MEEDIYLTKRQAEVLSLTALGYTPEEIADKLKIGRVTVNNYMQAARINLKANTTPHAVTIALYAQLIDVGKDI